MTYRVLFSEAAASDLEQLFDFALQRELDSETVDLDIPAKAVQAIKDSVLWYIDMHAVRRGGERGGLAHVHGLRARVVI